MSGERPHLERVYRPHDRDDLRGGYDLWARDYDRDMDRRGYRLPGLMTALTARYVPSDEGPLLDAGAGTGLLGEWLALAGYRDIEGIDLSPGMLDIARSRGVYGALATMALGDPLDLPDGRFRAVVSAGTFGIHHAPATGLGELIRITRPGGHVLWSVRVKGMAEAGFEAKTERLAEAGLWRILETVGPFQAMREEPESLYMAYACEVI